MRGVVQGVGFRPSVFRLAREHALTGWVLNAESGVEMHLEGPERALDAFLRDLKDASAPGRGHRFARRRTGDASGIPRLHHPREHSRSRQPTVRVSPDLCVCADCLGELFDPGDARAGYPYINCTNCGPRYSIIEGLPYDRAQTTMRGWALCAACEAQYHDANDRRFHAQPIACPTCGPRYSLARRRWEVRGSLGRRRSDPRRRGVDDAGSASLPSRVSAATTWRATRPMLAR